jgi:hypothetical protein
MPERLNPTIKAQTISFGYLQNCKGKTIADFEYGFAELLPDCHQTERIILHFTDGSRLTIDIGSNAFNLSTEHKGLKPKDFHTDLIAIFRKDGKD